MSITKSQTEKVGPIFKGNKFIVPIYQRKYSWTDKERKALWDDIEESIAYRMNHFLGTLVFEEKSAKGLSTDTVYEIIDGQQRLSTIYILLHTLIEKIKDKTTKDDLIKEFIGTIETKVQLSGEDKDYFDNLILNYNKVKTKTHIKRSQKRLFNAKQSNSLKLWLMH